MVRVVKGFADSANGGFVVDPENVHMGVVKFSSSDKTTAAMSLDQCQADVVNCIDGYQGFTSEFSFQFQGGGTDWDAALAECEIMLTDSDHGAREVSDGVLKSIVIVGDGTGFDTFDTDVFKNVFKPYRDRG